MKNKILTVLTKLCKSKIKNNITIPTNVKVDPFMCRNYGVFTYDLQKSLSNDHYTISLSKIRYYLKKLKKEGLLISSSNKGGYTYWWVKGLLK
jgi:hypothetical protein